MKAVGGPVQLAATDLANHVSCGHLTTLSLKFARGEIGGYTNFDPLLKILAERGRAHEDAYVDYLRAAGKRVEDAEGLASPIDLMRAGVPVITQGKLASGIWAGRTDFLIRVERPCTHWAWSYEVIDTKLATNTRAGAVLQLCVYSDLLGELQGLAPDWMHIVKPGPDFPRDSYRFDEYAAYYRLLRRDLEARVVTTLETYPQPTPHCDSCNWRSRCETQRRANDHLSFVADLGRLRQRELERVGIHTLTELAQAPTPWPFTPERGSVTTYERLEHQARLQVAARTLPVPPVELLPVEPERGFARLPEPSLGDVFLDLEGDPFIGDAGREYLFGWVTADRGYDYVWAIDDAAERAAFERLIDTIMARLAANPGLHVYHFAAYETTALKRLAGRYATRADELDRLLRGQRFIDLHSVIRQALRAGVESYSIKLLEPIIGFTREIALDNAGTSHRGLRLALQRGTPEAIDPAWRPDVEAYNRDDCASAAMLRDWLEARRSDLIASGAAISRPPLRDGEPEAVTEVRGAAAETAALLLAGIPDDRHARSDVQHATWLLGHLMEWYARERKVAWWDFFRLATLSDDERLEDAKAIAGLKHLERIVPRRGNPIDRYWFPAQEVLLKAGEELHLDAELKVGSVFAIDPEAQIIEIKRTRATLDQPLTSAFGAKMVNPKPKDGALVQLGQSVVARRFPPATQPSLARDLLLRSPPRGLAAPGSDLRLPGEPANECAPRLALALNGTVLPIQGPPGSGKTETAAKMIVALIRAGRRVGITATSHAVIENLATRVVEVAASQGLTPHVVLKSDEPDETQHPGIEYTTSAADAEARMPELDLLGATAWQWARDGMRRTVDVLFIDEAGQMSLADALAVTAAAQSLVLVGDPQQLEQPIQGTHPDGVGVSVLEHVLGGVETIASDRGLFLDQTHRLHPSICTFTSEQFYERRLLAGPDVGRQTIATSAIAHPGLYWLPVEHRGNQNRSIEEAAAVADLVARCLAPGARWTNAQGAERDLTTGDLRIVAPYNAHVAAIRDALAARGLGDVPVGTVDKFQGQQAAIAIYSMATSDPADAPRGLAFLYDRHRLNVATSRARCASVVVASPALLRPDCATPTHLHLASALARFVELSTATARQPPESPRISGPPPEAPPPTSVHSSRTPGTLEPVSVPSPPAAARPPRDHDAPATPVTKSPKPMITLETLTKGMSLVGIEPTLVVTLVAVVPIGDGAVQAIYKTSDGTLKERLLTRADETSISVATEERPWAFDGNGEDFKLAIEAKRMDLAFLFDPMMAVHTSNVQPLPHQITAVYDAMLPRQPLRFVLADDPGAGKTIMAGLYIRELLMRADARRVLIVAPGSLVEQWRDELFQKFGLEFRVFSKELDAASPSGNPFDDHDHLIVRLDQVARNAELQEKLCLAGWDLIVFDEAHKLSAHFYGTKIEKTGRFQLAERLGRHTRHLLLMTATPHNGKEEDFQLFLSLLDSDRFYGKFRDGVHKVDCSDLMRRMVKEQMVKFDGTPLFPERKAYTVNYPLSDIEAALYEAVTQYVQTEMGKADQLEGARKGSVGFALTALQRRLASSPEAIYQSLRRRKERLEQRVRDEKLGTRGQQILAATAVSAVPDDDDELDADEQETLEETLVEGATTAHTIAELELEIVLLRKLEHQAKAVVVSGQDRKWEELSKILQHNPEMHDVGGRQRKLIIFSEHRDTLNYLHDKISGVLGNANSIITIHGGTHRDERRKLQELFRSDPEVRILIATDAAGEGVNLQNANLMVNYDLPWNPNRLEQRFGRIHRIGQQEVCHLWNLVAKETREGAVFFRLLEKLRVEGAALNGRVFDILGDVFEGTRLKDLLVEAIRYGDRPEVRARLKQQVEHAFDHDHLRSILDRNALAQESMSAERLFAVKEEMERAEARRLQPYFVRSFFTKAFAALGGTMHPREADRFEVTHVPASIRERDRLITGRNRRELAPVLKRYERVCFTRDAVQPADKPNAPFAAMLHPGHPLMLAVSDLLLEQHGNLLRQGAILVDPTDEGEEPHLLFLLTHEIKSGNDQVLSKRMQFVRVAPDGSTTFAGWAPHLDLEPLATNDRSLLTELLAARWIRADQEQRALALAAVSLVPEHFKEVAERRIAHVDKTLAAVHERLTKEIAFLSDRWMKLKDDQAAGKDVRLNLENARRTVSDLEGRLENRRKELQAMRHVTSGTPVALGGALVVPIGLLRKLRGEPPADDAPMFSADAAARRRIELLAMAAVRKAEEARGCRVEDVSAKKCGWDLTSYPPTVDGKVPEQRHIEVKGRVQGATTVTVTANEIFYAFNQAEKFFLAIVLVGEGDVVDGPHYVQNPFGSEAGWGVASVNYELKALLAKATSTR